MLKVRMFERSEISVEEGYLVKRVLRGLINIRAITLWKVKGRALCGGDSRAMGNMYYANMWQIFSGRTHS